LPDEKYPRQLRTCYFLLYIAAGTVLFCAGLSSGLLSEFEKDDVI
jgi:hypothetical protein